MVLTRVTKSESQLKCMRRVTPSMLAKIFDSKLFLEHMDERQNINYIVLSYRIGMPVHSFAWYVMAHAYMIGTCFLFRRKRHFQSKKSVFMYKQYAFDLELCEQRRHVHHWAETNGSTSELSKDAVIPRE